MSRPFTAQLQAVLYNQSVTREAGPSLPAYFRQEYAEVIHLSIVSKGKQNRAFNSEMRGWALKYLYYHLENRYPLNNQKIAMLFVHGGVTRMHSSFVKLHIYSVRRSAFQLEISCTPTWAWLN